MQEGRVIPERLSITVRPPDIPSERRYPPSFRTARTLRMSAIRLIDGDLASNAKEPHPLQVAVASGIVLQVDQAAPANQVFLWHQRECCEDPNLDCRVGLCTGRHRPEAFGPGDQPLPNSTDFERDAF